MNTVLQYIATTPTSGEQAAIWFAALLCIALLFIGLSNIQR